MPKQFDIIENPSVRTRRDFPFLIVLQSDQVSSFSTVIAAPLAPASGVLERSRIHPIVEVDGAPYVIFSERLAAVQTNQLGRVVGSADASWDKITAALDMLFTGI